MILHHAALAAAEFRSSNGYTVKCSIRCSKIRREKPPTPRNFRFPHLLRYLFPYGK